ncbi:AAA family ATPase, partial [Streptomyces sp. NPDC059340]|uniref:AAA family ATPase n=1 Tax=Streptomyces sp. NPDC059340 TaxID=3346806 RepID=UPI0036BAF783
MTQGDAVVIGVGTFRDHVPMDEEVPVGSPAWPTLEFVESLVPRVRDAFGRLGYRVRCHINPVQEELRDALVPAGGEAEDGHRIVHVISHGQADPDRMRLDMVPADGRVGRDTNVAGWISDSDAEGRLSLFLVDLCGSGVAARLPSSVYEAGQQTYAWVIAASDGREEAYDGRFSTAVADVLDDLARMGLGTDPSQEFVDFHLVARHIGIRLENAGARVQTVRATLMDPSAPKPKLPFFPNPAHPAFVADPVRTQRAALDPPVRDFLEEVDPVDARHFTDKPGRHFTGRRSQLRLLAPWLDNPDAPRLCVVTGSPGTGKSALLGALMCVAHPQLAEQAAHIRERLPAACRPALHERLAAVQARQRSLSAVLSALARQLHLPAPDDEWTAEAFMDAIRAMPEPPVLVVDALDEAVNPGHVTEDLLLPLTSGCRPDGQPVCRVLLGMRPWEQFDQLKARAEATGQLIDLDQSSTDELEEDLTAYLDDVLTHVDGYRTGPARPVREHLTRTAATRLARAPQQGAKWGEFLVASVFTSYLVSTPAVGDIPSAQALGNRVPVTLPNVLELDLSSRSTPATARALLVAIAHAKGNGIPAELAYPLAKALRQTADPACFPQILDESMFYLRTQIDSDGTTLYRTFHQGLADHLRTHPYHRASLPDTNAPRDEIPAAELVLNTLLASRTQADRIVWANAAPYLLRHAIEHAADAGKTEKLIADAEFLVHADASTLTAALSTATSPTAALTAAVYRTSLHFHRHTPPESRRSILATDAARHRATSMHYQLTRPLPVGTWRPRWATGSALMAGLQHTLDGHTDKVTAVVPTTLDDRAVAITGSVDGTVRAWDLITGEPLDQPFIKDPRRVFAMACTIRDGRAVAVTGNLASTVRVWDLTSGEPLLQFRTDHFQVVWSVACTVLDGRAVAVTGGIDGRARVWDLTSGEPLQQYLSPTAPVGEAAVACTALNGRAVILKAGTVDVFDLTSGQKFVKPLTSHRREVSAVACTALDGRAVAVTGGTDGTVRVWDLTSGEPLVQPLTGHRREVSAVACTALNGRAVAVTGGTDGTVRVWDLTSGEPLHETPHHVGEFSALACTALNGRIVAVTGGTDGTVRVWDLTSTEPLNQPLAGHTKRVTAIAPTRLDGRIVAATGSADGTVRVWDLTSGTPLRQILVTDRAYGKGVTAVALTALAGLALIVAGDDHGMVGMWDLATGELRSTRSIFGNVTALACTVLDGRPVAVIGSTDSTVYVWGVFYNDPPDEILTGHTGGVSAVACTVLDGRTVAVIGSTDSTESTVRIWDLASGQRIGQPFTGHTGGVSAVACTVLDGRTVAVIGSTDGTVRIWDLASGQRIGQPFTGHTGGVSAVACTV